MRSVTMGAQVVTWPREEQMENLIRTHIQVTSSQRRALKDLAARDDVSMAFIARRAIDFYVRVAGGPQAAELRARAAAAIGTLGPTTETAGNERPSSDDDFSQGPYWWSAS